MVNTDVISVLFGAKLFRTALLYVSNIVSKNFTSQIYLDKVLVKGEAPPKLTNQVMLAALLEFVMFVILLGIFYGVNEMLGLFPNLPKEAFTSYLLFDFIFYMVTMFSIGSIVADVMYRKKYFLYKDDGLRAIRALSELMVTISLLLTAIPFNFLMFGIVAELKK
jgi:hypothetical protein